MSDELPKPITARARPHVHYIQRVLLLKRDKIDIRRINNNFFFLCNVQKLSLYIFEHPSYVIRIIRGGVRLISFFFSPRFIRTAYGV